MIREQKIRRRDIGLDGSLGQGRVARAAAIIMVAFILIGVYKNAIVPLFSYAGLVWEDLYLGRILVSLIFVSVASLLLPRRIDRPAQFVVSALFLLVLVPVSTIPLVSGILEPNHAQALSVVASACFALLAVASQKFALKTNSPKSAWSSDVFIPLAVAGAVLCLLVIYVLAGFDIQKPDFSEAHDVRLEFRDILTSSSPILAYAVPLSVKVLNPLLLVIGLQWKKWWIVVLSLVGQLSIFTLNGQRSILVGTAGALFVYLVFRRWNRIRVSRFFFAAGLFIALSWVIFVALGSATLMSLFVRRLIVVPGVLTGVYHSYYDDSNFVRLQQSRLFSFGDPQPAPPRVIGEYFTGNPDIASNANFLADGYANFGWFGVISFTIVLALVFVVLNWVSIGLRKEVVFALLVGPTFALSDTALFTTMLTHGLLALLLILAVYPRLRDVVPKENTGVSEV